MMGTLAGVIEATAWTLECAPASDEFSRPDLLAKFVSAPIYNEISSGDRRSERHLGGLQRGK